MDAFLENRSVTIVAEVMIAIHIASLGELWAGGSEDYLFEGGGVGSVPAVADGDVSGRAADGGGFEQRAAEMAAEEKRGGGDWVELGGGVVWI